MAGISKTLKDIKLSDDVLIGLSGTAEVTVVQTLLSGDSTVEAAKINGTAIYAPKQHVVSAEAYNIGGDLTSIGRITIDGTHVELSANVYGRASDDKLGLVQTGTAPEGQNNYALKITDDGYAYVNVPWTDKFCTSAWYDSQTKQICLSVGPDVLSVNVADLVKTYEADGTTTELNGNKFSVKSGIYADSIAAESKHMNLNNYTLGGYLSALTQNLGGTCTDN